MEEMRLLIRRLRDSGVIVPEEVEKAMLIVDIADFTEYEIDGFYHDRPVVFLETPNGGVKTISAPHMVVTLLHHLELSAGQEVVVYGAKGGYICALIAHILGEEGHVTVLDPSVEVISHLSSSLRVYPTVECHVIQETPNVNLPELNRVLVTGQIGSLPDWLKDGLTDGGFAIAPIGDRDSQNLVKLEKQDSELFETDLGSVIFGPIDIQDTIVSTPSPEEMAEMVEQVVELMSEIGLIESDDRARLYDLVAELRQLPDDLPPPEEMDDPSEHPMLRLMMDEGEWFMRFWPVVQAMMGSRLASPGSKDYSYSGSEHDDFIP